jgi:hypothetical protein
MFARRIYSFAAVSAMALLLAAGQRASADTTLNLEFAGAASGSVPVTLSLDGGKTIQVTPGPYFFNSSPPPSGGGSPISTFCIQLTAGLDSTSFAPYSVVSLTNSSTTIAQNNPKNVQGVANAIEALYGEFYQTSWGTQSGGSLMSSAFQLALW